MRWRLPEVGAERYGANARANANQGPVASGTPADRPAQFVKMFENRHHQRESKDGETA